MSKLALSIMVLFLFTVIVVYGAMFNKLLAEIERSAINTIETYCGPELAKQFKTRGYCE